MLSSWWRWMERNLTCLRTCWFLSLGKPDHMQNEFRDHQTAHRTNWSWMVSSCFFCASPRGQGKFLCTALFSNGLLQLWHAFLETVFRRSNCVLATFKWIGERTWRGCCEFSFGRHAFRLHSGFMNHRSVWHIPMFLTWIECRTAEFSALVFPTHPRPQVKTRTLQLDGIATSGAWTGP